MNAILEAPVTGRPTLGELVPQYVAVNFTKKRAVQLIVECHMSSRNGRGKGRKAAKREAKLFEERWQATNAICAQVNARKRRVYGVVKPTNDDRRAFAHIESPQF